MEQRQRFFIYDRKEMGVLLVLGLMVSIFAFTLGVHLGKRIGPKGLVAEGDGSIPVDTSTDALPNRPEFNQQAKGVPNAVDEVLSQSLHDEVTSTGVKLDHPRPVDLPEETVNKNAGATTNAKGAAGKGTYAAADETTMAAARRTAPAGKYTLQIGSYPTLDEARDHIDALEALELKPHLRSADLKDKGKWYRVYLGGFETKEDADEAGARYKAKKVIEGYLVANRVD